MCICIVLYFSVLCWLLCDKAQANYYILYCKYLNNIASIAWNKPNNNVSKTSFKYNINYNNNNNNNVTDRNVNRTLVHRSITITITITYQHPSPPITIITITTTTTTTITAQTHATQGMVSGMVTDMVLGIIPVQVQVHAVNCSIRWSARIEVPLNSWAICSKV